MSKIKELLSLDVGKYIEKKNKMDYLPWASAWQEFIKIYPDAIYKIVKNETTSIPTFGNEATGWMCYTTVTAGEITHEMWLPVMNHSNKVILKPNMFEINKTIMRCLVKNLAMFGLGLYVYAGEDLPEPEALTKEQEKEMELAKEQVEIENYKKHVVMLIKSLGQEQSSLEEHYGFKLEFASYKQISELYSKLVKKQEKIDNAK